MSKRECPDCSHGVEFDRRMFLKTAGAAALTAAVPSLAFAAAAKKEPPETYVKKLYDTLTDAQRKEICFPWDYLEKPGGRGLLRTRISNNWDITNRYIGSDFYTKDQKELIRTIFEGIYRPEWIPTIEKQLQDDAGGYGQSQSIAIFGRPGNDRFEFVMTGRHITIRSDGNSTEHMAFGGPIFYGHAASGFDEKVGHPGNVFWHQAQRANKVYQMLDGRQRKKALVARRPAEEAVGFRGPNGMFPGIPVVEMSSDQKGEVEKTLASLLAPYRNSDQQKVRACLTAQGGLDRCSLSFYADGDLGNDGEWDNWRLEGPSFVWYFRGSPHVHVWVHVANSPKVELNAET
ncbi:MAG TPA: DUF3500 domain-containing protein [Polyangiaceae bacterium]|nr:DUF3500 domain-containing protein [Polyangiaceae bacterium]